MGGAEREKTTRESKVMEKKIEKKIEATGLKGGWFRWQCNNINEERKGGGRGKEREREGEERKEEREREMIFQTCCKMYQKKEGWRDDDEG